MTPSDGKSPKIAVIILTMNQREKTIRCLSSLRSVKIPSHHILVWDNGSNDSTIEVIRAEFPEVTVHRHPTNLGAASGRNAAAQLAGRVFDPSYFLFLDNDMIVSRSFMEELLKPFGGDRKLAQTVAKIRLFRDNQRLNDAGGCRIQYWLGRTNPIGIGELDQGQYERPSKCVASGGATLVREDVFKEHDGFDSQFDPYGYEDLDFALRISKSGYYSLYVPPAIVFHDRSQTFEGGEYTEKYAIQKARNWFLFMRRHAPVYQQLAFLFIGAPYTLLCVLLREGRKGNITAVRGLLRGMFHSLHFTRHGRA